MTATPDREHLRREDAAGLVMLDEDDAERVAAEAHAEGCAECAAELASARKALSALEALDDVAVASDRRLAAIRAAIPLPTESPRAEAGRGRAGALAAVVVAVAAAAIFRGFSDSVLSWIEAGAALGLGIGAILSVRDDASGRTAAVVAGAGAAAIAMLSIEPGEAVEWRHAAFCAGTQLVGALAPAAIALAIPGGRSSGWVVAGRGAGGALVALAALSLVCPAHSAMHVLVFHVLSVAAAAVVSTAVAGLVGRRASTS